MAHSIAWQTQKPFENVENWKIIQDDVSDDEVCGMVRLRCVWWLCALFTCFRAHVRCSHTQEMEEEQKQASRGEVGLCIEPA